MFVYHLDHPQSILSFEKLDLTKHPLQTRTGVFHKIWDIVFVGQRVHRDRQPWSPKRTLSVAEVVAGFRACVVALHLERSFDAAVRTIVHEVDHGFDYNWIIFFQLNNASGSFLYFLSVAKP